MYPKQVTRQVQALLQHAFNRINKTTADMRKAAPVHEVAAHPQHVARLDALARPDLRAQDKSNRFSNMHL